MKLLNCLLATLFVLSACAVNTEDPNMLNGDENGGLNALDINNGQTLDRRTYEENPNMLDMGGTRNHVNLESDFDKIREAVALMDNYEVNSVFGDGYTVYVTVSTNEKLSKKQKQREIDNIREAIITANPRYEYKIDLKSK
ncbi:hypothetical protein EJF36_19900 [Bacillus sp. HMF5848]|uniref:hypothetical protein n=1 Tax=Bacillus sp. HMF5848 TaxID=2495421 RepID=UPI000F79195A|nr:hypothetical protein [Bacillus sp. HMF5848]RSK28961.1 hypothetical protein EJF36_19900 [Bacillus sp. HMF5848]